MRALQLVGLSILIVTSNVVMAQFSGIFGPSNYDECVFENMKGVTSDVAAAWIADSCAHKFPRKASEPDAKRDTPLELGVDYVYRQEWNSQSGMEVSIINKTSKPIRYVGLTAYNPCENRTTPDQGDLGARGNSLSVLDTIYPGEMQVVMTLPMTEAFWAQVQKGIICLLPTVFWSF